VVASRWVASANVGRLLRCTVGLDNVGRLLHCIAGDCESGVRIKGSTSACLIAKSLCSGSSTSSSDGGSLFGFLVGASSSVSMFDLVGSLMSSS
jgi:hypothetical protein